MNRRMVEKLIKEHPNEYYVYVLKDEKGQPFYVGLGRGARIFQHEQEALDARNQGSKARKIRKLLRSGSMVSYEIDSFHESTPWHREEELIRMLGSRYDLTNMQSYAPAEEKDGVILRKYAAAYSDGQPVTAIPQDFPYRSTKLMTGPRRPSPRAKVYGRICQVLEENPGITGECLIAKLHDIDWSDVKSAYTEGRSRVSGKWLADYVKGGFYKKNQYIQSYNGTGQ